MSAIVREFEHSLELPFFGIGMKTDLFQSCGHIWSHHFIANRCGNNEIVTDFIFLGSKIIVDADYNHEIKRCLFLGRKAMTNLDSLLKSRDITLPTKLYVIKAMVFPVVMYGYVSWIIKKSWTWKNLYLWTVVPEKTLEGSLDCKEIKPVHPKGNQSWLFIGRTDTEAATLWPPGVKNRLIGKDPDAGKDWKQEEKGKTEDEMLDGITESMDKNMSKLQEMVKDRKAWCAAVQGFTKTQTGLSYWITTTLLMTVFGKGSCKTGLRVLRIKFLF